MNSNLIDFNPFYLCHRVLVFDFLQAVLVFSTLQYSISFKQEVNIILRQALHKTVFLCDEFLR